ncbi:MAG: FHA domain-containing protein, partial [Luteimonas sp.]|nr:FHA domain-containing protein [Luteimonas sp.]
MDAVRLRFPDQDRADHPLSIGVLGIGRRGRGGIELLEGDGDCAVRLCVDRRGMWLAVDEGAPGVHVNGRQVRRMAMLRVGDAVYVDGVEMRLVSALPPRTVPDAPRDCDGDAAPDLRVVLRGVGGQFHGRSFTLERPRLVGRSADADIRIDTPAFAERHARLELVGEEVVLRDLGSGEGSLVNGEPVRDAVLLAGDQVVFDAHHRFVVEAP